jgi:hypothetical protein
MKKIILVLLFGLLFLSDTFAKTVFLGSSCGDYKYIIYNDKLGTLKYTCSDGADPYRLLNTYITLMGAPTETYCNNTALDKEVAIITKKHGNSITKRGAWVHYNIYDTTDKAFTTFVFWDILNYYSYF